ncbi:MAG: hypothetical protein AVDCRST_MAG33-215 [uncultured Thermomicrobiales bacterium]|uniref:Uncharacterized protein n=1 Tax=uncultured Thermomicrobiales bacterium TaxID=1645740 RepID=A0A6J4UAN5_9BACT|nr:MAG: hypothetical protein AVDCRST_MAG33-215 [uncultured Thermomicrobiales bacterium]
MGVGAIRHVAGGHRAAARRGRASDDPTRPVVDLSTGLSRVRCGRGRMATR